ncbi:hypothetical protein GCK72_016842 [Caenorhabditis remanei]|uniref:Uncharacterized protein n=1 Tax=Caenorhabditis remanei TaxID=31234 RepID=A0A6A5G6U7_CAERE|nr:hypothetical protein GCK72_016842 [Caenorhabditis remanei]KAF1750294.1 hypothetical protein GCK72_016842 [Caenorhabditis remanei]
MGLWTSRQQQQQQIECRNVPTLKDQSNEISTLMARCGINMPSVSADSSESAANDLDLTISMLENDIRILLLRHIQHNHDMMNKILKQLGDGIDDTTRTYSSLKKYLENVFDSGNNSNRITSLTREQRICRANKHVVGLQSDCERLMRSLSEAEMEQIERNEDNEEVLHSLMTDLSSRAFQYFSSCNKELIEILFNHALLDEPKEQSVRVDTENMLAILNRDFLLAYTFHKNQQYDEFRKNCSRLTASFGSFFEEYQCQESHLMTCCSSIRDGVPFARHPELAGLQQILRALSKDLLNFDLSWSENEKKFSSCRNEAKTLVDALHTLFSTVQSRIDRHQTYIELGNEARVVNDEKCCMKIYDEVAENVKNLNGVMLKFNVGHSQAFENVLSDRPVLTGGGATRELVPSTTDENTTRPATLNFETKSQQDLKISIENLEKRKIDEMKFLEVETEKKLKEIEKKKETEKAKYEELVAEIKKNADKTLEEKMKVYNGIIEKNKKLLEVDQLKLEKEILETDEDLRKIHDSINETIVGDMEKTDMKREKMVEERKKRVEEKLKEILEKKQENLESELRVEKEIAVKDDELHDKKNQHIDELGVANLQTQRGLFTTLLTKNKKYNNDVMNDLIKRLTSTQDEINEESSRCRRFMRDRVEWDDGNLRRAEEAFENLSFSFNTARKELTNTERRLAEIQDEKASDELLKQIREMRRVLFLLDNCVAGFCGRFMMGDTNRSLEDEKELSTLMQKFSEIQFSSFHSKKADLETQLSNNLPDVQPVSPQEEQKRIEQ